MSGKHDPALLGKAAYAVERAEKPKNATYDDVGRAVLDAVADDIARAERERVLAEVEALLSTERFSLEGRHNPVATGRLRDLVARLRGGEDT